MGDFNKNSKPKQKPSHFRTEKRRQKHQFLSEIMGFQTRELNFFFLQNCMENWIFVKIWKIFPKIKT